MSRIKTTTERAAPNLELPLDEWRGTATLVARAKKAGQEVEPLDLKEISKKIHKNFVANDISTWHYVGEEWCGVRETYKKVYWIPSERIIKDKHSQNRKKDSIPKVVSAYANKMENQGQYKAYSVWIKPDDPVSVRRRWGNTRDRGLKELYNDGRAAAGNPLGCSRVNVYSEPLSELPAWQSRENHIHEPGEPNVLKDDIKGLAKAVKNNLLDYGNCPDVEYDSSNKDNYDKLNDDEKKERLRRYCKQFMVLRSGKNFNSFYEAYKRDKSDDFSIISWTGPELRKRFLDGNPFGISKDDKVSAGGIHCYVKDGVRYGLWTGPDIYTKGAQMQQVRKAKKIGKLCDVTILVTAASPNSTDKIDASRNKIKSDIEGWNNLSTVPDIDHLLQAPLTEEEELGDDRWIVHNKF